MVFYVTPSEYLDLLTHNLKAAGSNPAPATNHTPYPQGQGVFYGRSQKIIWQSFAGLTLSIINKFVVEVCNCLAEAISQDRCYERLLAATRLNRNKLQI